MALLDDMAGARGVRRARTVIELADDGAESPGETATRFVVLRAGLPVPRTQIEVTTRLGTFWADLGWEEWRVLVEYDGRLTLAVPGTSFTADLVLEAIGRLAKAVGVRPGQFVAALRL